MGNCASSQNVRAKRPRRRLPRKIKIRDRRRGAQSLAKIRTTSTSIGSGQHGRRSVETVSPRSFVSDESIYYSDTEWHDGSPFHPHHLGHHDSALREEAVEGIADEQTLVDKLATWWHGFSLLGDDGGDNGGNSGEGDDVGVEGDGMLERIEEHQAQRRLRPHPVAIVEGDDDSLSTSLSYVSFSKKKRPLQLSRVSLGSLVESGAHKIRGPEEDLSKKALGPSSMPKTNDSKRYTRSWSNPDPSTFYVRSKHYMKDKIKLPAQCSLYRLVKVETVTFASRKNHIAEHLEVPAPSEASVNAGKRVGLRPMLIIQLQMPMYSPVLFGDHDGESCSLIYYSELDPGVIDMPRHAIDMAVRFTVGGTEEDGQATRDRLKLIPRIVNVEEWGREAGLSGTELRLVTNYNGKPLLMRPQFKFHDDPGQAYFEVDVDIHNYAYIARRAFCGYVPRLGPSVFENGFVIQGNNEHELPEVLLMASRVYRMDFRGAPRMSI